MRSGVNSLPGRKHLTLVYHYNRLGFGHVNSPPPDHFGDGLLGAVHPHAAPVEPVHEQSEENEEQGRSQ